MSDEKNTTANDEKNTTANTNAQKSKPPAEVVAKDAEIAELKAKLAALESKPSAGAKVAPRVELTDANAKDPVRVRLKHGIFIGATHDGPVFEHEKPAKVGETMRLARAHAYRVVDAGTFELC